nr:MAG TPA: MqsA [Caudoviricetes sp.]
MNAEQIFEELGYQRNVENEKIIYLIETKGSFYYQEIIFNLVQKVIVIDGNFLEVAIENDLLKAINKQAKELGWLEEETCTNGSTYDSTEEFICSHCGLTLIEYKEYVNGEDDGEGYYFDFKPKYCPNCGRKIVD